MTRSTRIGIISGAIAGVVILIVVIAVVLRLATAPPATGTRDVTTSDVTPLTRGDTHVLGEPGASEVTVVEFLDFECEACGAFYPYVEQLRKDYAGEVTFAFRYFPLPGHGNAQNAAAAVEAAAQQDQLEPMYQRMFETQAEWGERGSDSQADRFRGYAKDLGLNVTQYDRDVASGRVADRIQRDIDDGTALGIQSTPSFFVDGKLLQLTSYDDLDTAIADALERRSR
ncbi:thioredoxin domain-containing protein [Curtobacterium sp. MCJR17_020]|uniref:DsbA family protein n=1 Tax=Curtobacterium sp. MCJR17_020 TaxID=2175619 RepID=UPI000DA88029|nr:thioredoxin domain-containing protein [Curtobacterium sp. MCJR17_020]WIE70409.1 thioredoxin domain-containing protein [Curtobacterium sp. MCJR17_020]